MVDRTKQPGGCIRISEKCVFTLKSLLSRYGKQLRAAIRNFHLGPCKIEKSKIAKLCHNKGLPKPFIKM